LRVSFQHAVMRDATLVKTPSANELRITDAAGTVYRRTLSPQPDALVVYFISNRPGIALWTSPATFDYVGFAGHAVTLWRAQTVPKIHKGDPR